MAKTKQQKEILVAQTLQMIKGAKGGVFADFTGLTVKEISELRRLLKTQGIEYEVLKKTLLAKSLEATTVTGLAADNFTGSVSLAISSSDEVTTAKTLVEFAKKHDKLQILGGLMNQSFISQEQVKILARLPGKPELLGQLVGSLASPLSGLARVLVGNLRGLIQVLSALAKKQA